MSLMQTVVSGLRAVGAYRMRSMLTSLGILIGVCALIVTVGIGTGTKSSIGRGLTRLGTNLITVTPGTVVVNGVSQGLGARTTLTMDDVQAIGDRSAAPDVLAVAPLIARSNVVLAAGAQNWSTTVIGSTPNFLVTNARYIGSGTNFTDADLAESGHVVVLGNTTAQSLFPDGDAVGNVVTIQKVPFRVIGILSVVGATGTFNPDDLAVIPITTAQLTLNAPVPAGATTIGGVTVGMSNVLQTVQRIQVSATSRDTIDAARQEVTSLLLQTHHVTDPSQADFKVTTQEQILNTLDSTSAALTLLLAGVAGIALLVGGIGVMNIMLVSVTERISEIGLRKALGARRADILRQFLIEAATLSAGGGVIGVGLGALATYVLNHFTSLATVFVPSVAVIGVLISIGIGVVFGVLPAMRAARLEPIRALRGV
jgi:putative ABC transport system permease protein